MWFNSKYSLKKSFRYYILLLCPIKISYKVYTQKGFYMWIADNWKDYEQFVRCHRSYLINMDYVQNISSKTITMTDGIQIPIPHGKYSELKDKFFDYFFRKNQTFLA